MALQNDREFLDSKVLRLITTLINAFFFGLGVATFVIGVLYLTTYYYAYTYSQFNPTVVAGIFVPFGTVIAILALAIIIILQIMIRQHKNRRAAYKSTQDTNVNKLTPILGVIVAACFVFILVLFIILLAIGIWGLATYSDSGSFENEVRNNLMSGIKSYVLNGDDNGIDWVQSTVIHFHMFKLKYKSVFLVIKREVGQDFNHKTKNRYCFRKIEKLIKSVDIPKRKLPLEFLS